jgi:predicted TIM-barrel fold metal-dependent hydrolase
MASEAIYVAATCPNVYLETGWGALPRFKEGIEEIGAGRLIFGSDCPIQEMGSQLRPIEVLGWDEPIGINLPREEIDGILGNTLWSLIGKP